MPSAHDTALRYLVILQNLPVYPQKISTKAIAGRIAQHAPELMASTRTLQRDLNKLSTLFPIGSDDEGRRYDWYWRDKQAYMQLPDMDSPTALALRLAEDYLSMLFPSSLQPQLVPYFKLAQQKLKNTQLSRWAEKIHYISHSSLLTAPKIAPSIQSKVHLALLEGKQLLVEYCSRRHQEIRQHRLQPFGQVIHNGIHYLVAGSAKYDTPNHYSLHRMQSAQVIHEPAYVPREFSLKAYAEGQAAFAYPRSGKQIRLKLLFAEETGFHLLESKLSQDQVVKQNSDGTWRVTATVQDTSQLRWWLLGLGQQVEILSPKALRREFSQIFNVLITKYRSGDTPNPTRGNSNERTTAYQ